MIYRSVTFIENSKLAVHNLNKSSTVSIHSNFFTLTINVYLLFLVIYFSVIIFN